MMQCLPATAEPFTEPDGGRSRVLSTLRKRRYGNKWIAGALGLAAVLLSGCGGRSSAVAVPVLLTVSIADTVYSLATDGSALFVSVIIVAPTETASFVIAGLPAGVSASYKESESNPSGLLTLIASPSTPPGTYTPQVTVGSSGQTAAATFKLVVQTPKM